jgi:hypothetical protein
MILSAIEMMHKVAVAVHSNYKNLHKTPWSRVLPEKLICLQLLKKFPTFYGIRKFLVVNFYRN